MYLALPCFFMTSFFLLPLHKGLDPSVPTRIGIALFRYLHGTRLILIICISCLPFSRWNKQKRSFCLPLTIETHTTSVRVARNPPRPIPFGSGIFSSLANPIVICLFRGVWWRIKRLQPWREPFLDLAVFFSSLLIVATTLGKRKLSFFFCRYLLVLVWRDKKVNCWWLLRPRDETTTTTTRARASLISWLHCSSHSLIIRTVFARKEKGRIELLQSLPHHDAFADFTLGSALGIGVDSFGR